MTIESTQTGGVKPMSIAGRMVRERERLAGMSDEERAWRKQWLKDLELHHEPREVPELDRKLMNPIRRAYRAPLDAVYNALIPVVGQPRAWAIRFYTGKAAIMAATVLAVTYYFKYNQNDWTRKGGWRVIQARHSCNPGDEGFPKLSDRSLPEDYAARGFKQSPI